MALLGLVGAAPSPWTAPGWPHLEQPVPWRSSSNATQSGVQFPPIRASVVAGLLLHASYGRHKSTRVGARRRGLLRSDVELHADISSGGERHTVGVRVASDPGGRGLCLLTVSDAKPGEILLYEAKPLYAELSDATSVSAATALLALAPEMRKKLLQLSHKVPLPESVETDISKAAGGCKEAATLLRVTAVNGICLPGNGTGVYATASRANHSCQPNAAFRAERDESLCLVAIRPLSVGEQVTVSYLTEHSLLRPHAERQHQLKRWGFRCTCPRCSTADDTRSFLCPSCGLGYVSPAAENSSSWTCNSCGASPRADLLDRAEQRWGRGLPQVKTSFTEVGARLAVRRFAALRKAWLLRRLGKCVGGTALPVPRLDGHWLASSLAQSAAEALMQRGRYADAAEAARWQWRFAKRTLAGTLSRTAANALALRSSAAVLSSQLPARRSRNVVGVPAHLLRRAAKHRGRAALREAEAVLGTHDALLKRLRQQQELLSLLR